MCVVPKLRGRGLGGQLLEEGIRLAEEELKCRKLTIYSVRSLVTAMHLYTKAGFREVSFYLFITVLNKCWSVFSKYYFVFVS